MRARFFPAFLSAGLIGLALSGPLPGAKATTILAFSQNGISNTVTGTNNNAGTTTITSSGTSVSVSGIDAAISTPFNAFLNLSATNISTAVLSAGSVTQHFQGSFSITSNANGTGTNYLSGTFTDSVFGANGGTGLTLTAAQPPGSVTFTSGVIPDLLLPRAISLSFTNVTPAVGITNNSLSSFSSSVSGNFSATAAVPEPATIAAALSALPILGLYWARRRRQA
jgi:hypothetical protein